LIKAIFREQAKQAAAHGEGGTGVLREVIRPIHAERLKHRVAGCGYGESAVERPDPCDCAHTTKLSLAPAREPSSASVAIATRMHDGRSVMLKLGIFDFAINFPARKLFERKGTTEERNV
jgi:hypothetical protein